MCVCACVCARVCVCARACMCVREREREFCPLSGFGIPVHLYPYRYTVPRQPVSVHTVLPPRTASPTREPLPKWTIICRLQMEAVVWTSWLPDPSDSEPWVQAVLSDYYVIKAVVIAGMLID